MINFSTIQIICIWAFPILLAITFHEAAHAFVANRCGDNTAKQLGRLSLNPFRHFDLIGSLIVPLFLAVLTQFHLIFGWAKPVPISWHKLKNPRLDMIKVAAAGPISNFIMAFLFYLLWKKLSTMPASNHLIYVYFLESSRAGILINIFLGWLNLFPLPPLDGSRIVSACLPPRFAQYYDSLEPYGFLILLLLISTGILQLWLQLPLKWLSQIL
jgi:Zn-dependent protease